MTLRTIQWLKKRHVLRTRWFVFRRGAEVKKIGFRCIDHVKISRLHIILITLAIWTDVTDETIFHRKTTISTMENLCKKTQVTTLLQLYIKNVFIIFNTFLKINWYLYNFEHCLYFQLCIKWYSIEQKFQVSEQTSHKIIEKRRRDRINSCLSELSQTVPAAFSKQVNAECHIFICFFSNRKYQENSSHKLKNRKEFN